MRTPTTAIALIVVLTMSTALAQGLAPPSATVGQSGQADTEIQATWPMPAPPFQAVLSPVAASVAPQAGAGAAVGRGGGMGPMTGQRGGPGAMAGRGPRGDGMKGHGQGNGNWRDHAKGNKGDFRHSPYGHRPWGNMNRNPNNGYNNQSDYSSYGGYSYPNYGYNYYPYYGYNYYPYSYYPYYGYNSWPNFFGYNYWNPAYYYNPGYGYYGW